MYCVAQRFCAKTAWVRCRITGLKDLPSDNLMLGWLCEAAEFVDSGQHTSPIAARRKVVKAPKPVLETPASLRLR